MRKRTPLNILKITLALIAIFAFEYFIYYIYKQAGYQNTALMILLLVIFGIGITLVILIPYMMYSWRSSE